MRGSTGGRRLSVDLGESPLAVQEDWDGECRENLSKQRRWMKEQKNNLLAELYPGGIAPVTGREKIRAGRRMSTLGFGDIGGGGRRLYG